MNYSPAYHPAYPRRSTNWGVLLFLTILAVAAPTIYLRWHAKDIHGSEAEQTRNCIRNNGVWRTYWEGDDIYHLICQDPATRTFFDMVVQKISDGVYKEKTAFRPKDGKTVRTHRSIVPKKTQWCTVPGDAVEDPRRAEASTLCNKIGYNFVH